MPHGNPLLSQLEQAVQEASVIAQEGFRSRDYELKGDGSIVTQTDKKVERLFRERLAAIVPGASFWGEEYGFVPASDEGLWLVDPIDGTSNFAFGIPLWGITAALYRNGRLEAGVMALPEFGQTISAAAGCGAWLNGERMAQIRPGKVLPCELVGHGDSEYYFEDRWPGKMRHLGSFVIESAWFTTQNLRGLASNTVELYDCATGIIAARELGAEIRHWSGELLDESKWIQPGRMEHFVFLPPDSGIAF